MRQVACQSSLLCFLKPLLVAGDEAAQSKVHTLATQAKSAH